MRTRLSWKLALVVTLGIAVVHAGFGYLRVRREVVLFEGNMRQHHASIAHALAVSAVWAASRGGADAAIELIEDADFQTDGVEIRWLGQGSAADGPQPASQSFVASSWVEQRVQDRQLVSQVPLVLGTEAGLLELRESLRAEEAYLADTNARTLLMTLTLVALCFAILTAAGWLLIRKPMRALLSKVDRIGRGDLSGPLMLKQRDELGTLASAINMMCAQLERLHAKSEREARAKSAAIEQLRHADRLSTIGKLASGIAHELGTPLNVVSARAKMIARQQSQGEEVLDDARVIAEQTERMAGIIRQLLDFARRHKPEQTEEVVARLCHQTLTMLEPLAGKQGVELTLHEDEPNITAKVDPGQLLQVLANLVMNAIQAQPRGGEVRLQIWRWEDNSPLAAAAHGHARVSIAVEDDGGGMSEEVKARLFEPFFTTKDVGQGTGLGLSVVYGIVQEHGGWLDVQSQPGRGSRFVVHLPQEAA